MMRGMMNPVEGTVENGIVRLSRSGVLREGQRVIVIPVPPTPGHLALSAEAEEEDVAFVRASRGRLARQLGSEEQLDG
jgi:hypothetical protein